MAVKKKSKKKAPSKSGASKRPSATRSSSKRPDRSASSTNDAVNRLGGIARELTQLGDKLRPLVSDTTVSPNPGDGVSALALRRLDFMAALLARESERLAVIHSPPAPGVPAPITHSSTLAFSLLPDFDADDKSVSVGIPGVGNVSIGHDGASANVDGVGSVSIGQDGVSVNAGGANVSVGGDGVSVNVPGAGNVHVGPDGSVSVSPEKGDNHPPGLPFPNIPVPSFCTNELKIPIPIPRFVMQPFDIPIATPRFDPTPFPIGVPTFKPEPWPISVPFPDMNQAIEGFLRWGGAGGFDPAVEVQVDRMLKGILNTLEDELKEMAKAIRDANDAAGNTHDQLVHKIRAWVEQVAGVLIPNLRGVLASLNDLILNTAGIVTAAMRSLAAQLLAFVRAILGKLIDLLKLAEEFTNPTGAIVAIVRSIYLVLAWIASRVQPLVGFSAEMAEDFVKVGKRLDAV